MHEYASGEGSHSRMRSHVVWGYLRMADIGEGGNQREEREGAREREIVVVTKQQHRLSGVESLRDQIERSWCSLT